MIPVITLPADMPMWLVIFICISVGTMCALIAYWVIVFAFWLGARREAKRIDGEWTDGG